MNVSTWQLVMASSLIVLIPLALFVVLSAYFCHLMAKHFPTVYNHHRKKFIHYFITYFFLQLWYLLTGILFISGLVKNN